MTKGRATLPIYGQRLRTGRRGAPSSCHAQPVTEILSVQFKELMRGHFHREVIVRLVNRFPMPLAGWHARFDPILLLGDDKVTFVLRIAGFFIHCRSRVIAGLA